jgi:hypothetical protein
MAPLTLLFHLLNFVAPAIFVGLLLAAVGPWVSGKPRQRFNFRVRWAILSAANAAVLVAGLVITGADGGMLTYAALVLVAASTQWFMGQSGPRGR